MSANVVNFPGSQSDKDKILEQACLWLAKLDATEGQSQELNEEVSAWLQESPEHVSTLIEVAKLWDQMDVLAELSEIFPLEHNLEPVAKTYTRKAMLAAGIALFISVISFGLISSNSDQGVMPTNIQMTYSTQVGEQSEILLPDGSEIVLNTDTLIDVVYQDEVRNIYLNHGEGLFKVASDKSRPFRVHAGSRVVEAVGTAFSVQHLLDDQVEVLVTEGEIKVSTVVSEEALALQSPDSNTSFNMIAGDYYSELVASSISQNLEVRKLEVSEIESRLAWQHGMLLFEGEPLVEVLAEIGRYTTVQFELDEEVKNLQVEGYFQASDIDGVLLALKNNFNINVQTLSENQIFIGPF